MSNICEICGEVFDTGRIKSNHVRWKHKDNSKYLSKLSDISTVRLENKYGGKIKSFIVNCYKCRTQFEVLERENKFPKKDKYFCCQSCANKRVHTIATKRLISKKHKLNPIFSELAKKLWQDPEYITKQLKNNKRKFTSKGEEEIRKYFMETYPDDGWTFGGHLLIDEIGLIRDLYSKKLKICVEYNGIWHYKDIHGQLAEKQLKDKKLKKWCRINGYKLIIVKDDEYRKNKEKVLQSLEKRIYENTIT